MNKYFIFLIALLSLAVTACEKKFLDKQPRSTLVIPKTLEELRALLDHNQMITNYPQLGDVSADNYSILTSTWQAILSIPRNTYVWASDIFEGSSSFDWNNSYNKVFTANVVLEILPKIQRTDANKADWDNIKGAALFHRAFSFYQLSQLFCQTYRRESALTDLGIPLRLTSDINAEVSRSTVQQTYNRIIQDLDSAAALLPDTVSQILRNRPNKAAAHALLARIYLVMGEYSKVIKHASDCLALYAELLDLNTISINSTRPFVEQINVEILFQARQVNYGVFNSASIIDGALFDSYENNDLRKTAYFSTNTSTQNKFFKGQYTGLTSLFAGLATDEVYLTRAEAKARLNDIGGAVADMNSLLIKKWKSATYVPYDESDPETVLRFILSERNKELLLRGTRWSDLRRLNLEDQFKKTLVREVNGVEFTLLPNDKRYILPIPPDEIRASGIEQNPR